MNSPKPLIVAGLQIHLAWEEIDQNLHRIEDYLEQVGTVDLVLLPEMFSTGFSMRVKDLAPKNTVVIDWMKRITRERDFALAGSLSFLERGKYYNRFFCVEDGEILHTYDKRHLFSLAKEEEIYSAGTDRKVFELRGWRICPLICYDLRFPVWSKNREEYDLLLYVANWPERRIEAWDVLLRARAIENMSAVIGVNRVGKDGNGVYHNGHSVIIDSLGKIIEELDPGAEGWVIAELRKDEIDRNREKFGFLKDGDAFNCLGLPPRK